MLGQHGTGYRHSCTTCQKSKLGMPPCAPLQNIPIGQPWQMVLYTYCKFPFLPIIIIIYVLVLQESFTRWDDALPNQTANHIVKFFCTYWPSQIIHPDQGCNFENTILTQVLHVFGVHKSHTIPYHPQGDGMIEWFNRIFLQLLRAYVTSWEIYLPQCLPHSTSQ